MKTIHLVTLLFLFFACTGKKTEADSNVNEITETEIQVPEFHSILDAADVKGSVLVYDLNEDKYYSNNFQWARKGKLPASTFKITNSIIALETGIVENDSTLFKWNGEERRLKSWEQDLVFRDAFHFSCVPCYQEVARKIGVKNMSEYLKKLDYGNMDVDSTNIDVFWLEGKSRISQFQQIDFLKRFYTSELSITESTERIMTRMMVMEENTAYKLSGKTGWSIRNGNNNGWFVGYLEAEDNTYFFATNLEPKLEFDMERFPEIRKEVTFQAFEQMKLVNNAASLIKKL